MKIIMDFRKYDGVVGGVEQGAIQVTKYIANHGGRVILVCKESRETQARNIFGPLEGLTIVSLPVHTHAISISNTRIDSGFLQDMAERENADLIHFFYNWSFPFRKKVPCLLTIHDVIPFTFREAMGFFRNRFLYRPSLKTACRLNDAIATVSEFSKQDISKKVGASLDKIHVIPNGMRTPEKLDSGIRDDLVRRFNIQNGFILNVGGIHERKNIIRLIHSFAKLVRENNYMGNLFITGSVAGAPYQEKMKKQCDAAVVETNMKSRVIFTGIITEQELDILLEAADLFIYPSLYEGFGIPVLEAMQAGTPVITSNVTAMPEVAGEAAILVDPYNVEHMASEMSRLLHDEQLRKKLVSKGLERARGYSWERTCGQYLELYKTIVNNKKNPA